MVMKPIRKCRRKEAKSFTFPTVADGSFWLELQFGNDARKVRMAAKYLSMRESELSKKHS